MRVGRGGRVGIGEGGGESESEGRGGEGGGEVFGRESAHPTLRHPTHARNYAQSAEVCLTRILNRMKLGLRTKHLTALRAWWYCRDSGVM